MASFQVLAIPRWFTRGNVWNSEWWWCLKPEMTWRVVKKGTETTTTIYKTAYVITLLKRCLGPSLASSLRWQFGMWSNFLLWQRNVIFSQQTFFPSLWSTLTSFELFSDEKRSLTKLMKWPDSTRKKSRRVYYRKEFCKNEKVTRVARESKISLRNGLTWVHSVPQSDLSVDFYP